MIQGRIDKIASLTANTTPEPLPEPLGPTPPEGDLALLFEARMNELRGPGDEEPAVLHVRDGGAVGHRVRELCEGVPPGEILFEGDEPGEAKDRPLGITTASFLIAATGSIILDMPEQAAVQASLLVDSHIVVASREQLLPDLPSFYAELGRRHAAGKEMRNQVCITGCSRTADIEKLLVIPAHGPRRIRVVLCDEPIDWPALKAQLRGEG